MSSIVGKPCAWFQVLEDLLAHQFLFLFSIEEMASVR